MERTNLAKRVFHFKVTHPLGMHARVCSRWVKIMQQINDSAKATGWASICYNGEDIPANSLFKLLEARIPCGAEFDLCIRGDGEISTDALEKLAFSISNQSFDTVFDCTTP